LIVSWCAGGRCCMTCSDEDCGRSRRSDTEDRRWSYRSGGTVCGLHRARGCEEREFFDSASKPRSMVCQWFGLKTIGTVYQWFDLKITRMIFFSLASKSVVTIFSGLASKSVVIISHGLTSKPALCFLV
jgi:hypothetical protein